MIFRPVAPFITKRLNPFKINRFFSAFSAMDCKKKIDLDKADCERFVSLFGELKFQTHISLRLVQIEQHTGCERFCTLLQSLEGHLETELLDNCRWIFSNAYKYDFEEHRANGLRSFIYITQKCCVTLLLHLRHIKNDNFLSSWRSEGTYADLSAFINCLGELRQCLYYITKFTEFSRNDGSLFPPPDVLLLPRFQELLDQSNNISQEVFYGRCIGFYYCDSARRILEVLGCVMAGFSSTFKEKKSGIGAFVSTVMQSMASYWDQETRGRQIAYVTRHATVDFCKTFWSLNEHPLLLQAPNMILPPVDIAINFEVPAVPFQLPIQNHDDNGVDSRGTPSSRTITIPAPALTPIEKEKSGGSQASSNKVRLRIISLRRRKGMAWLAGEGPYLPRSPFLLLHVHGGGFVAQSAQAHDVYLRKWAEDLDCPIVSVDYSLAPAHPFPRALDECVYAYCWALKNARQLGSTGERVVMCGDSAGGNLTLGTQLRLAEMGVPVAHGLMIAYTPVHVSFMPSPSRLLSTMDPLLPVGILSRCLLAYAGIDENKLHKKPDTDSTPESQQNTSSSPQVCDKLSNQQQPKKTGRRKDFLLKSTSPEHLQSYHLTKSQSTPDLKNSKLLPRRLSSPPEEDELNSPLLRVRQAYIPPSPFMSPILASDRMLRQLPPLSIVACQLDPLLDDCVELAKRVSSLGNPVQMRVLDSIPHGFLNLTLLSKECNQGSEVCLDLIRQLFDMEVRQRDPPSSTSASEDGSTTS